MATPAKDGGNEGQAGHYPSGWSQLWLVGVLTLIYVLSFVDRGIITHMVNPIKADLRVSDTAISYVLGASFVTLYAILSVPAGYLADRFSRKTLILAGVTFWSMMQIVCGLATSYLQLLLGRVGLGLGKRFCPQRLFLIRDGVAPKFRSRAFAAYTMGPTLGSGLGALAAALLFASANNGGFDNVPLLSGLKAWQIVLIIPGIVGLPVALMLLTIHEPRRPAVAAAGAPTFGDLFAHVARNKAVYIAMLTSATLANMAVNGLVAWLPAAIGRSWEISPAVVGRTLGPIQIVMAPMAILVGFAMDRSKARWADGPLRIAILGCLVNAPLVVAMMFAPSLAQVWVFLAASTFFSATAWVQISCAGLMADITPGRLMGKATSFFFLVPNLVGVAAGPTLYALVSDAMFTGPRAISYATSICYPLIICGALTALAFTARACRQWRLETPPTQPSATVTA